MTAPLSSTRRSDARGRSEGALPSESARSKRSGWPVPVRVQSVRCRRSRDRRRARAELGTRACAQVGDLVARDPRQEFLQTVRVGDLVLTDRGPDQEAAEDHLADIRRVVDPPEPASRAAAPDDPADVGFIGVDELRRGQLVALPDELEQFLKSAHTRDSGCRRPSHLIRAGQNPAFQQSVVISPSFYGRGGPDRLERLSVGLRTPQDDAKPPLNFRLKIISDFLSAAGAESWGGSRPKSPLGALTVSQSCGILRVWPT